MPNIQSRLAIKQSWHNTVSLRGLIREAGPFIMFAYFWIYICGIIYSNFMLQTNPCQHPIVILRDITEDDLGCILKFMYHGEVQVAEEHLKDFLKTAETLQVKGLAEGSAIPVLADETGLGGNEVS